jgi:alpha-tubulin suppressor-like RCC1 family protein
VRRPLAGGLLGALAGLVLLATPASSAQASFGAAAWGANLTRQLGDGSISASSSTPVPVSELAGVTAISAGGYHSLALLADGTVRAWGNDEYGQLGDGATSSSGVPVTVSGLSGVTAIAAGGHHSLALLSNGTVMAWGDDEQGQLGIGSTKESPVPVAVKGLTGVRAIAAGAEHSLALLGNGTVMAWGENESGQLGDGKTIASTVPVAVKGLTGVTAIAAGSEHSLALLAGGTVMAWGDDSFDQLANGEVEEASDVPVPVLGLSGVVSIAAGANHNLARLTSGTVEAWGANARGQLGDGTTAIRDQTPTVVTGLTGVTAVAAGGARSMALLGDGTVRTWGDGASGALGDGASGGLSTIPVAVKGLGEVAGISAGARHDLTFGEPLPVVSAVSPSSGASSGGTSVTITGTNLAGATAVKFATKAAVSFAVDSSSSITAVAPAGTGTVNVTVTTPAGVSPLRSSDRFAYLPAPVVSKISPNVGPAHGGTIVTITGSGFTGASSVSFGTGVANTFTVTSDTSIAAVAPAGAPGLVDVRVTTPIATSVISTRDRFKYIPSVDGIAPDVGPVAGGTVVTITGSGFSTTTGATTIKFGTKHATLVQCSSSTTCTATAPAHEAGTVDVVATVNAEASAPSPPGDSFTYG